MHQTKHAAGRVANRIDRRALVDVLEQATLKHDPAKNGGVMLSQPRRETISWASASVGMGSSMVTRVSAVPPCAPATTQSPFDCGLIATLASLSKRNIQD